MITKRFGGFSAPFFPILYEKTCFEFHSSWYLIWHKDRSGQMFPLSAHLSAFHLSSLMWLSGVQKARSNTRNVSVRYILLRAGWQRKPRWNEWHKKWKRWRIMSEISFSNYPGFVVWDHVWFEYILDITIVQAEAQLDWLVEYFTQPV